MWAASQNEHPAPQIDSAFILFYAILNNKYPFIHLRIALFLTVIVVHTRTQRQARIHANGARVHYHLLDQPAYHWYMHTHWQRIRPRLLPTRLQRKTRSSGIFGTVKTVGDIWSLAMFSMIYCAQTHLPKIIVDSEKIMLALWTQPYWYCTSRILSQHRQRWWRSKRCD